MTSSNGNIFRVTGPLSKQSWGWRFQTPSRPLWRHSNEIWANDQHYFTSSVCKTCLTTIRHPILHFYTKFENLSTLLELILKPQHNEPQPLKNNSCHNATTGGAANGNKFGIMTTFGFHLQNHVHILLDILCVSSIHFTCIMTKERDTLQQQNNYIIISSTRNNTFHVYWLSIYKPVPPCKGTTCAIGLSTTFMHVNIC